MQSANPPERHHYIPAFYLKRWTSPHDNKLTQYSRPRGPNGPVVDARRAAKATGFEPGLYSLDDHPPAKAQVLEERFFKPIDGAAAKSLEMMEAAGNEAQWDSDRRTAWTRFLLSLLLRCPEDVKAFRGFWPDFFSETDAASEVRYRAARQPGDPETFAEFIQSQPLSYMEASRAGVWMNLIDNSRVGEKINNMHWRVIKLDHCVPSLLTSDRPMIMQVPLNEPGGHIALPIGPNTLFLASHDVDLMNRVLSVPPLTIAKGANVQVVEGAASYVYGTDASQLRFVQNRMGRNQAARTLQKIFEKRRNTTNPLP
ncbi:MAG: hypothetical protein B7Z40_18345 [Bosea sp. 12-68-7]|nr:MAG: hypothetical protein B7Z40_18345 [Bosea sp. 12-68-7]